MTKEIKVDWTHKLQSELEKDIEKLNENFNLEKLEQLLTTIYYSCIDCEWEGEITDCDFGTEYDEFKDIDRKYPICPICGGGLDC